MELTIEKKIVELTNKYIPLLDTEIELAEKQLALTRHRDFTRKALIPFAKRMEQE